jgi:hypothetical protein
MQKGQTLCELQVLVACIRPQPSTLLRRRPVATSHGRSLAAAVSDRVRGTGWHHPPDQGHA